ncbi:hypothetical protein BpHYR1_006874 [Brachionus plicatilis]|uniref:Uncharacterized protein n=1 Tax=Brachionus plicatilis TaxID=10195 RepID=A0A3M7T1X8_BRAPC|nr:hypothetical protein BpHYR1_006874 [Brachionus plicatilis]
MNKILTKCESMYFLNMCHYFDDECISKTEHFVLKQRNTDLKNNLKKSASCIVLKFGYINQQASALISLRD